MTLLEIRSSVSRVIDKTKNLLKRILGKVLVVDDNSAVLSTVFIALQQNKTWDIDTVMKTNIADARIALADGDIRAAVVDYWIDGGSSEEFCLELKSMGIPVVLMTGMPYDAEIRKFCVTNNIALVAKPFSVDKIYELLDAAILGGTKNDNVA